MVDPIDVGNELHRGFLSRYGRPTDRRTFLKVGGAAGAALAVGACAQPGIIDTPLGPIFIPGRPVFRLPLQSDSDILRFALFLELLEAQFYTLAVDAGILSGKVLDVATNVRDHENDHVDFLQSALGAGAFGQADVAFDFEDVLQSQATFLAAAVTFEQTGVGAYLGALPLISSPSTAEAAATIFTIEARHTSGFRALNGESAPVPDAFEDPLTPEEVVARVRPFTLSGLP